MPRAAKASARSTKGWKAAAPHTREERGKLYKRCGAKAFLMPNRKDPRLSKFPVMAKHGPCVVDCRALRAAETRARQYHHPEAHAKAKRLGKQAACHWAR